MTARPQHTPGPWEACDLGEDNGGMPWSRWSIVHGGPIAYGGDTTEVLEVSRANALVMAAAPDLLAACERLTQWVGKGIADGAYSECVLPRGAVHDLEMAEAAIRKARGTE